MQSLPMVRILSQGIIILKTPLPGDISPQTYILYIFTLTHR